MPESASGALAFVLPLLAAAGFHWLLRFTDRRLPLVLSRWVFGRTLTRPEPFMARVVAIVTVPLRLVVWVTALWWAAEVNATLCVAREAATTAVRLALTMPLFMRNGYNYTARDLLLLPVVLAGLWAAVGLFTRVVQARALQAIGVERGTAETLGILVRYGVTMVGGLVVLEAWGIDIRTLAIVGSVVGVGIGFGLQNLANNFISGLVIGLERPIKPGDYVRVGDFQGTVERIGPRSTEIVTNDRVSILVPNAKFLEHEVFNWTHDDPTSRVILLVNVAYESHLGRVRSALLAVAAEHPDVLREPEPRVSLERFGADGIELGLEFWSRQPQRQDGIKSDLNFGIHAAFRRQGIDVPFPQRDLRIHAPELHAAVLALARRGVTEEDVAAAREVVRRESGTVDDDDPGVFGPRRLDDAALKALVEQLRGPDGVEVADRRHLLTTYPRCFVGREAVDWMLRHANVNRDQAVRLGETLVERGIVRHVLDEHGFVDGPYFYRFAMDDAADA